jgi:hypothetical protein
MTCKYLQVMLASPCTAAKRFDKNIADLSLGEAPLVVSQASTFDLAQ